MQRKLTVTINEEVYDGLRAIIGPRKISRFIEGLVRPLDGSPYKTMQVIKKCA